MRAHFLPKSKREHSTALFPPHQFRFGEFAILENSQIPHNRKAYIMPECEMTAR
jgi:hypothetical protein